MDSDAEVIRILLVGDEKCGKTTFLSYVTHLSIAPHLTSLDSTRIRRLSAGDDVNPIPLLRDIDQPFIFNINLSEKKFRFEFYDTSCPDNWRLLDPDVVTICYDISQRLSMIDMQRYVRLPPLPL